MRLCCYTSDAPIIATSLHYSSVHTTSLWIQSVAVFQGSDTICLQTASTHPGTHKLTAFSKQRLLHVTNSDVESKEVFCKHPSTCTCHVCTSQATEDGAKYTPKRRTLYRTTTVDIRQSINERGLSPRCVRVCVCVC